MDNLIMLLTASIPLIFAIVLAIDVRKDKKAKEVFLPSLITLCIIEVPAFFVTIYGMITKNPQTTHLRSITILCFVGVALIYILYRRKKN